MACSSKPTAPAVLYFLACQQHQRWTGTKPSRSKQAAEVRQEQQRCEALLWASGHCGFTTLGLPVRCCLRHTPRLLLTRRLDHNADQPKGFWWTRMSIPRHRLEEFQVASCDAFLTWRWSPGRWTSRGQHWLHMSLLGVPQRPRRDPGRDPGETFISLTCFGDWRQSPVRQLPQRRLWNWSDWPSNRFRGQGDQRRITILGWFTPVA